MAFHIFTTQRVSCFGPYNRIDDLIPFNLRGNKCPVFRRLVVDKFNSSAIFKYFDPFLVSHGQSSSGEGGGVASIRPAVSGKSRVGNEDSTSDNPTYFQSTPSLGRPRRGCRELGFGGEIARAIFPRVQEGRVNGKGGPIESRPITKSEFR